MRIMDMQESAARPSSRMENGVPWHHSPKRRAENPHHPHVHGIIKNLHHGHGTDAVTIPIARRSIGASCRQFS